MNQGFAALTTPYVLLLNPDAEVLEGLDALRAACDLAGFGGGGRQIVGRQGASADRFHGPAVTNAANLTLEVLLLNRALPNNPINRRYRGLHSNYNMRIPAEQPAGAFLMVRREVWQELGGFDESFFPLWFEDVDFCRRVHDRGYQLYYVPEAVARHRGWSLNRTAISRETPHLLVW